MRAEFEMVGNYRLLAALDFQRPVERSARDSSSGEQIQWLSS